MRTRWSWLISKGIIPIPGTRKADRLRENAGAADIELTKEETASIDAALDGMEMSEMFGGHKTK